MTVTLELTPELEAALIEEAARRGLPPEGLTEPEKMAALIAGLKNRPVPQSFAELRPRRLPPPGKTAMQMVYRQLRAEEPDEEISKALEELS